MQAFLASFLQQGITLFAIMDPIGVSAIALSLLHADITKAQIKHVAYKSTLTIIIAFFVFDDSLLYHLIIYNKS